MNEGIKLILEANRLILRDRLWINGDCEDKAKVIDQEITKLLNPVKEPTLSELTKDAFSELSEVKDE